MGMMQSGRVVGMEDRGNSAIIVPLLGARPPSAEEVGAVPSAPSREAVAVTITPELEEAADDADSNDDEPEQDAGLPRDALGRLVLNLLHAMIPGRLEELQSARVASLVCRLRRRVMLTICCTVLAVPIALWLLLSGVVTYVSTESTDKPDCDSTLRLWLLGFLMLQLAWPICMPSLTLLLLGWCLGGVFILRPHQGCSKLSSFLEEAVALQALQAGFLIAAAVAALTARPIVQQIGEMLGHGGTSQEVITKITTVSTSSIPADEECVICLSRDDEEGLPWRELACNHRFHEPCLLEWLMKSHKCPVCRLDLHTAYNLNDSIGIGDVIAANG